MRGSLGSNLSLLFSALIYFPQSSELWGQVFEEYVAVEFGVELCGKVLEEYVTVEFGVELCGNCGGRFLRNM